MPIIGNNGRSFIHGLSDFWLRFFKDLGDLETTYEGMSVLLGQTYLNMLSDVLNTSVVDTPLFKQEYYRLITVREDQVTYVDTGSPVLATWRVETEQSYGSLPYLQNKVFDPTAGYEERLDYRVEGQSILFLDDPTEPVLNGFATRDLDVVIAGTFTAPGVNWVSGGVKKGDELIVNNSPEWSVGTVTPDPPNTLRYTIVKVSTDKLYLRADVALPETLTAYSWRIARTLTTGGLAGGLPRSLAAFNGVFTDTPSMRVQEVAFWAVDAMVDDHRLYEVYGHYFGEKRPSSETYRAFIRGLMQLYIFGPVIDRIESALNVMASLPVIRDDGEVLTAYDDGIIASGSDGSVLEDTFTAASASFSDVDVGGYVQLSDAANAVNIGIFQILVLVSPTSVVISPLPSFVVESGISWTYSRTDLQTVTTTAQTYEFPRRVPMREDVTDPASVGVLTFRAFDTLTTATVVTDYVKDPEWWYGKTLPASILNRGNAVDRVLSPNLLPNVIGEQGGFFIGDPGFYIGADEDGVVPADPDQPLYHHRAAFILMDRFLKTHYLNVTLDQSIDLSGALITEMQDILLELKPADSTLYFTPLSTFRDVITISDTLVQGAALGIADSAHAVNNQLAVGSSWRIGDTWKYSLAAGGVVLGNAGPAVDYIDVVVGGLDPGYQTIEAPAYTFTPIAVLATEPVGYYISRPLYVRTYP